MIIQIKKNTNQRNFSIRITYIPFVGTSTRVPKEKHPESSYMGTQRPPNPKHQSFLFEPTISKNNAQKTLPHSEPTQLLLLRKNSVIELFCHGWKQTQSPGNVPDTSPPDETNERRKKNMRKPDCLDVRLHWRQLIVSMHERWDNIKKKEPFRTWWR